MSLKRLAGLSLALTTEELLYEVPTGFHAFVTVSVAAISGTPAVRLALTSGGAPAATDWLAYDHVLGVSTPLVRKGIAMAAGERLYTYASAATVTAVAYGNEERLSGR